MRRIRINVDKKENRAIIGKRDTQNISMIKNIIIKKKTQRENTNVNVCNNSWRVIVPWKRLRKCYPVRIIRNSY